MKKPFITDEMLSCMQRDMQSGRIRPDRQQIADYQVPRLRFVIRRDRPIEYRLWNDGTPFVLPASSIAEARQLALAV